MFTLVTLPTVTCYYGDTIDKPQLNLASLSKLKKNDVRWLKLMMGKKMFTKSAISVIQSTLSPTLLGFDSDTSQNDDYYDDDNNDDDKDHINYCI